jgi:DinB superfamily
MDQALTGRVPGDGVGMDRAAVIEEMEQARRSFRQLLSDASQANLRRRSNGTRWTNRQLLFHMLFGYLIVRTLLPLVRGFGRRPDSWSRRFAAALNAGWRPFHVINYVGSVGGGQVVPQRAMIALMDRTILGLQRTLASETEESLGLKMRFPPDWDPYFRETMTILDVYHYGTQHFEHHRRQLTL